MRASASTEIDWLRLFEDDAIKAPGLAFDLYVDLYFDIDLNMNLNEVVSL